MYCAARTEAPYAIHLFTKSSESPLGLGRLARVSARRLVQDDRGRQFVCDLQEDRVLRRGVYELVIRREGEGGLPPALQVIVDEFEDERAEQQAAAEAAAAQN